MPQTNIIDRSPLKTTTTEALWSQSTRRMNEAKTAEEKASVVQNFAEQLRLEKLRAKRLQENMKEMNNALAHPAPPAGTSTPVLDLRPSPSSNQGNSSDHGQLSGAYSSQSSSVVKSHPSSIGRKEPQAEESTTETWMRPYSKNFMLFKPEPTMPDEFGQGTKESFNRMNKDFGRPPVGCASGDDPGSMKRRYSAETGVPLSAGYVDSPPVIKSPSSRPLNVFAKPFIMQPKVPSFPSGDAAGYRSPSPINPLSGSSLAENILRRASVSPPITAPPSMSVAPKVNTTNLRQQIMATLDSGRQRSASIGAQEKSPLAPRYSHGSNYTESAAAAVFGTRSSSITYNPPSRISPPVGGVGQFSHLVKNSDFPKSIQGDDASKAKRNMGSVKIGALSSGGEDWDAEYKNEPEKPKEEWQTKGDSPSQQEQHGYEKRTGGAVFSPEKRDFLTVLKERDDISHRRYNREVMLRLYESGACKIRPAHLSPTFNNDIGLWSPDLWFHVNFQSDTPQSIGNRAKFINGGRGAVSVDSAEKPSPAQMLGFRRVSCLSAFQQNKDDNGRAPPNQ